MKTCDILSIDCRKEEGFYSLQKYVRKIPPLKKKYEGLESSEKTSWNMNGVPIDVLEKVLHQYCIRKGYQVMNIQPFYGKNHDEFVFYTSSAKRKKGNVWIGNVYGISLYEIVVKLIIMIYADTKNPKEENKDK